MTLPLSAVMQTYEDPAYCHAEPSEHRHDFVQGPARDKTRQTWVDPMIGVEIYVDTGDPVYNFPYRPSAGKACRFCGRPEKTTGRGR